MNDKICKNCIEFRPGIHGWGECEKHSTKLYKKLMKKQWGDNAYIGVEVGTHENNWCPKWEATDD